MLQEQTNFVPATGNTRRSQAVMGYGVGSIIDFLPGSFMPLGLEVHEYRTAQLAGQVASMKIFEPRLQRLLGVDEFRSAPIPSDKDLRPLKNQVDRRFAIPCVRFPEWLECPKCRRLGTVGMPFELQPNLHVRCPSCKVDVNPVRFIVCCADGHITDFPWVVWAHRGTTICGAPKLYLESQGKSASLGDLAVQCKNRGCQAKSQSLQDIFRPNELRNMGLRCPGRSPWLPGQTEHCAEVPVTVQRGGSNVYFPVTASMISIPPASEAVAHCMEQFWPMLSSIPTVTRDVAAAAYADAHNIDRDLVSAWIVERQKIDEGINLQDEAAARYQEYLALSRNCAAKEVGGHVSDFENAVFMPPAKLQYWFDLIGTVRRLREVRATCGFTRLTAQPLPAEAIAPALQNGKINRLSKNHTNWLPAVQLRGEGVFIRFREAAVADWASSNQGVVDRAGLLDRIHANACMERGYDPPYRITPRLLLVHSFAHALIRRLSLDCGYSSASLRERLYVAEPEEGVAPMCGVLIYTGTPDSDGSLGGLVAQATPARIEYLINKSIQDSRWCSSDPVCLETDPGQAPDRLSGASCHSCLLLPETACEKYNKELDRTVLVGNSSDITGFFPEENI